MHNAPITANRYFLSEYYNKLYPNRRLVISHNATPRQTSLTEKLSSSRSRLGTPHKNGNFQFVAQNLVFCIEQYRDCSRILYPWAKGPRYLQKCYEKIFHILTFLACCSISFVCANLKPGCYFNSVISIIHTFATFLNR